jgi:hypothetical protein
MLSAGENGIEKYNRTSSCRYGEDTNGDVLGYRLRGRVVTDETDGEDYYAVESSVVVDDDDGESYYRLAVADDCEADSGASRGRTSWPKHFRLSLPAGLSAGRFGSESSSVGPGGGAHLSVSFLEDDTSVDAGADLGGELASLSASGEGKDRSLLSLLKVGGYGELALSKRFRLGLNPFFAYGSVGRDDKDGASATRLVGGGAGVFVKTPLYDAREDRSSPAYGAVWELVVNVVGARMHASGDERDEPFDLLQTTAALSFGM